MGLGSVYQSSTETTANACFMTPQAKNIKALNQSEMMEKLPFTKTNFKTIPIFRFQPQLCGHSLRVSYSSNSADLFNYDLSGRFGTYFNGKIMNLTANANEFVKGKI